MRALPSVRILLESLPEESFHCPLQRIPRWQRLPNGLVTFSGAYSASCPVRPIFCGGNRADASL